MAIQTESQRSYGHHLRDKETSYFFRSWSIPKEVLIMEFNFQDKEVASLIENLYSKLKLVLVRKDEQKSAALRAHLSRIDGLLERRGTR